MKALNVALLLSVGWTVAAVLITLISFPIALVLMFIFNAIATHLFGFGPISYWQAYVVCWILSMLGTFLGTRITFND